MANNHPNRSRRPDAPGRNPKPQEVRAAREAAGLTVAAAASLIHCSAVTWSQWESGPENERSRRMHPAFWELFAIKVRRRRSANAVLLPPRRRPREPGAGEPPG